MNGSPVNDAVASNGAAGWGGGLGGEFAAAMWVGSVEASLGFSVLLAAFSTPNTSGDGLVVVVDVVRGVIEVICERVSTGNLSEAEVLMLVFASATAFRCVSEEEDPLAPVTLRLAPSGCGCGLSLTIEAAALDDSSVEACGRMPLGAALT